MRVFASESIADAVKRKPHGQDVHQRPSARMPHTITGVTDGVTPGTAFDLAPDFPLGVLRDVASGMPHDSSAGGSMTHDQSARLSPWERLVSFQSLSPTSFSQQANPTGMGVPN